MNKTEQNILLSPFNTFEQTPPFSKIDIGDYKPAIEWAIEVARARVRDIVESNEPASFETVIAPLEYAGEELDRITSIFFNLNHAHTSEAMQEIALEVSPIISEYSSSITLNTELFQKIKIVYLNGMDGLDEEQRRVTEKCFKSFERCGANLCDKDKEEYREITKILSKKSIEFDQNVLGATNDYILHLTSESELEGLPQFVRDSAASEASERNVEGWVITLQAQSMMPFLQFSARRDLREIVWSKYASRCYGGDKFNNEDIVKEIVNLRLRKANLLGFATYADFILEERMAKSASKVNSFLDELLSSSIEFGRRDIETIRAFAATKGFEEELMGWDFSYYSELYRNEVMNLSDEELKPFFELTAIKDALFALSTEMYGITYEIDETIDKYHKDVVCYRVYDSNKSLISILYLDFFPRATKSGGAWMTTFRDHHVVNGEKKIPQVSLVCNFSKPTSKTPSLLTFSEVTTMFHEFGHALHGMFAEGSYGSISGTNVAWDFVELPSQIMENWATERQFLERAAKHYQTGEVISSQLVDKIIKSRNFLSGYSSVRQLSFGISDMAWHTITEPFEGNARDFELQSTERCRLMPVVDGCMQSTAFSHIFSGGYSAGYYSYKWAEVLEADAFTRFQKEGVLNRTTAEDFRRTILSKGDIKDAMELYIDFIGREPKVEPLLEKLGLKQ